MFGAWFMGNCINTHISDGTAVVVVYTVRVPDVVYPFLRRVVQLINTSENKNKQLQSRWERCRKNLCTTITDSALNADEGRKPLER